jgi:hypothetical protein
MASCGWSIEVKWLFLLSASVAGAATAVLLSGVCAGKHTLSGFEFVMRSPGNLFFLILLVWLWIDFVNDIAASKGVTRILGHSVRFHERRMYIDPEAGTGLFSLETKLRRVYPASIFAIFLVLTFMIWRS